MILKRKYMRFIKMERGRWQTALLIEGARRVGKYHYRRVCKMNIDLHTNWF